MMSDLTVFDRATQRLEKSRAYIRDLLPSGSIDDRMFMYDTSRELQRIRSTLARKKQEFRPDYGTLAVSVMWLAKLGLGLGPHKRQAVLLSFSSRHSGLHEIVPCVMVGGYRELARRARPDIVDIRTRVVMKGDEWDHWEDVHGEHYRWREAPLDKRQRLTASSGINYANIVAGFCTIRFRSDDPIPGVVPGYVIREKLRSNKNIGRGGPDSAWVSAANAMAEKTVAKEVLSRRILSEVSAISEEEGMFSAGRWQDVRDRVGEGCVGDSDLPARESSQGSIGSSLTEDVLGRQK